MYLIIMPVHPALAPVFYKKWQGNAADQPLCKLFFIIFVLQFDQGGIEIAYSSYCLVVGHSL
ncbi:hypothetical protein A4R26_18675 [Niastella populi]|uniref:Uncharacterized protein n=1 Tax=Niastella populi TaxID=550983 RepID=A0A1V9FTC4_9BACT|nr:hypothetical protein A4R26_18675 [Niastella populi]